MEIPKQPAMNSDMGTDKPDDFSLPSEVLNALWRGNKIEAIRLLRKEWGIGLAEAKEAVEAYSRNHPRKPVMQAVTPEAVRLGGKSGLGGLLPAILVLAIAIGLYLWNMR